MRIYTSSCGGKKLETLKECGMGVLIPSSPTRPPSVGLADVTCALDNGAFSCWQKGYPFMERFFMSTLETCYRLSIPLEFIVCPDLVAKGMESLRFSIRWATERLCGCPCLALAVQDGMTPNLVHKSTSDIHFKYIFVGGTLEWKWDTAKEWVAFAHDNGLKCHIGRVGNRYKIDYCKYIGADSIDSSSFARNGSFYNATQTNLWE